MPPRKSGPSAALLVILPVALLAAVLWGRALFGAVDLYAAQYTDARYAVYLDSGHIFYGKITGVSPFSIRLSDVYSFQTVSVGETSTSNLSAQTDNPLTLPRDWMSINRKNVLFYERVGEDASIMRIINSKQ
jgi:hypothetical protein